MRVLVTGAGGQLGTDLLPAFAAHDVVGLTSAQLDVTDVAAVGSAVAAHRPDVVVNAAAYTAVDACEADPEPAWRVNAAGALHLAKACAAAGAVLVHVSTDYVFDGLAQRPYTEFDATGPRTAYGRTKEAGEQLVRQALDRHYIVRTAWLHGGGGQTFADKVLARARASGSATVVDDQRGSPTFTVDLAEAIVTLAEQQPPFGIYHRTGTGSCTWFEFATRLLALVGLDVPVTPVSSDAFAAPAVRPRNSVLDNRMAMLAGLPPLPPWEASLARFADAL